MKQFQIGLCSSNELQSAWLVSHWAGRLISWQLTDCLIASLLSTGMSLYRTVRIPYFLMYLMNYRWVEWNNLFSVVWLSHSLKYLSPYPQENDLKTQFQSVRLAIGGGLLKEGKIFEAMELFEMVKTPPGLYNLAQVREKRTIMFCVWIYMTSWSASNVSQELHQAGPDRIIHVDLHFWILFKLLNEEFTMPKW